MLKIDVDEFSHKTRFELQKIMHSIPCPLFVRLSSSREGLHIAAPLCDEWDYRRYAYDDQMRVDLDTQRTIKKLPVHNLLWDIKNGKVAGWWRIIRNSREVENFLDSLATQPIYTPAAYYNLTGKHQQKT